MGSAIEYDTSALAYEDEGYHKGLKPRQLQMIAIGGAIGTGLFMGPRPHTAGPGFFIVYAVCGLFVFFTCAHWVSLCCIALRPDRSSPVRANSSVKRPLCGRVVQRAINSVVFRIAVFYVGSLVLLTLLLPYTAYKQGTSPFVTFFSSIGVPAAGDIVNFVVLTAALSSLNAGLYSTGRILRSMAMNGSAPAFTAKMTKHGVPFAGIALTACFTVAGVFLNLVVPSEAFNIAAAAVVSSALGIIASESGRAGGDRPGARRRLVRRTGAGAGDGHRARRLHRQLPRHRRDALMDEFLDKDAKE